MTEQEIQDWQTRLTAHSPAAFTPLASVAPLVAALLESLAADPGPRNVRPGRE